MIMNLNTIGRSLGPKNGNKRESQAELHRMLTSGAAISGGGSMDSPHNVSKQYRASARASALNNKQMLYDQKKILLKKFTGAFSEEEEFERDDDRRQSLPGTEPAPIGSDQMYGFHGLPALSRPGNSPKMNMQLHNAKNVTRKKGLTSTETTNRGSFSNTFDDFRTARTSLPDIDGRYFPRTQI